MKPITVVLVEPQAIFLHGVQRDLELASDIEVVGATTSGTDGIDLVRDLNPNVAVIALRMQDMDGIKLLIERKDMYGTKIVVLTAEEHEETVYECMMLGAQGYLFKWGISDLGDTIRRVHGGEIVMCSQSLRAFVHAARRNEAQKTRRAPRTNNLLTNRECEVLELVGVGKHQAEIAENLNLSVATVKTHLRNTYAKLGVKRSAAAVQEAIRLGLIDRRQNGR